MSTPRTLDYARLLILVQAYRIVGVLFLVEFQRGNLPAAFAIPAGVGDILIAITAPLVAVSLRKRSPMTLAFALTWNALGITDLVNAVTLGFLAGGAQYILTSYLVVIPSVLVPLAIVLHIAAIILLARRIRHPAV